MMRLRVLLVLTLMSLLAGACNDVDGGPTSGASAAASSTAAGPITVPDAGGWPLPSHSISPEEGLPASLTAEVELELHGSCIYVTRFSGRWAMVLWPPNWRVVPEDEGHRLVSPDGATAARIGDIVRIGGGGIEAREWALELAGDTIPGDCPEPEEFWMGSQVLPGN
jgi:hypothetical protein